MFFCWGWGGEPRAKSCRRPIIQSLVWFGLGLGLGLASPERSLAVLYIGYYIQPLIGLPLDPTLQFLGKYWVPILGSKICQRTPLDGRPIHAPQIHTAGLKLRPLNLTPFSLAGSRFVPDHTPEIDRRSLQRNYPNCPLVIFWHLYSKAGFQISTIYHPIRSALKVALQYRGCLYDLQFL